MDIPLSANRQLQLFFNAAANVVFLGLNTGRPLATSLRVTFAGIEQMQFGMYLYDGGIITAEQFVQAVRLQGEQIVPLGVIAMEEGKLAVRDVFSILRVQSDLPNDRFGDIAIDLGLMTKRDLAELLMMQSDRRVSLGDCLVSLGVLSDEQLAHSMAAYRRDRERGGTSSVRRVACNLPTEPQKTERQQKLPEVVGAS